MPAAVEGHNIRDACTPRSQHCQRRDKGMIALNMNEVPLARCDGGINAGGKIIVLLLRPGANALDGDSITNFLGRKLAADICRQHGDMMSLCRKTTPNLIGVALCSARIGEET